MTKPTAPTKKKIAEELWKRGELPRPAIQDLYKRGLLPASVIEQLWRKGDLTFKLHSCQTQVYDSIAALSKKVREAVFLISRRWGKSFLITAMAIEDCLKNPGKQIFIIGPDLKHTRRIITPLIKIITADAPADLIKQNKSELSWTIGEGTLLVGAFDTALESLRGLDAFAIYLEESALANMEDYEYTIKSVLRPTLMHSRGRMIHATTPPKEENHPFIYTTMAEADSNNALYRYTIRDNPLLTEDEIEDEIKIAGGIDSPHTRRELFCQIVRERSRVILPEFNEEEHVKSLVQPSHTFYLTCIDFGGSLDPHAILLTYFDFERNKFCILAERMLPVNTGTADIIKATLEMEKQFGVKWLRKSPLRITDAPGQVRVDLTQANFECLPPIKAKDSVQDGIQLFRVDLARKAIEIDPRCEITIQTFKYAMWDRQRKGFQRTDLLGHCDALAAAIYAHRHVDRYSNPFPGAYDNMSRDSYSIPVVSSSGVTDSIVNIFLGDD